ncbi:helix-turn-helix transcriptional regulator [Sphingomonadaceae bacterium LXI357]|uniref:Helix-turn-helix transcriptional regulator n=1 Tax=Stakelama marina TaxID=2826939 RepID=A0A8T4I7E0_9SPHN|nr:helix-turn-helix transcriptional regulator [Stakelama marina]
MIEIDRFRKVVFPNRLRELRIEAGHPTLVGFAAHVTDIPYIRLSKIERGEVVARAVELRRVAAALAVSPTALLIDIDSQYFDIARWASPFGIEEDGEEAELAMLLAAALRQRRTDDAALTLAALESEYGLPPVIVSRVEHAAKPVDRWNAATIAALCAIIGVADPEHLEQGLRQLHADGALDEALRQIPGATEREDRTRERVAALRRELSEPATTPLPGNEPAHTNVDSAEKRMLAVIGSPIADGLIADIATGEHIAAPLGAGPRAYALRIFRSTLGPGLPASAILTVDPDRFPAPGGLAVIRENGALRVVGISTDRTGAMIGFSLNPDSSVAIDVLSPQDVAAVTAASF